MFDLVIKNGYIYDGENIKKINIGINNGIITLLNDVNNATYKETIDAKDKIVMPGFINSHIHFGEYYAKGYERKLSTEEYINYVEKINTLNLNLKEKIRTSSSIFATYESLEYGSTTLMGIRGWNCVDKFNLRLLMGYPLMNSDKLKEFLDKPFKKFNLLKDNSMQTHYIFLHSLQTVNEDILKSLSAFLKNKNIKLAIHLSETIKENEYALKHYKLTPTKVLEKYHLLSENTLLIHACYLSEEDIKTIKKYKCTICACPSSNLKLGNSLLNIKSILENKINLCIGTDGTATNDSLNLLDSCKLLGLLTDIPVNNIIDMITINPARFLKDKIGQINNNFKADLILYDLNDYKIVRKETFLNNIIYSSSIKPSHVIINGKIIINNYENLIMNKDELIKNKINYIKYY